MEKKHLGGICLNWGCIPTKRCLIRRDLSLYARCQAHGLSCEGFRSTWLDVIARSRGVSKQLSGGVGHLLKKNKVTVVDGAAKLNGPGRRRGSGNG